MQKLDKIRCDKNKVCVESLNVVIRLNELEREKGVWLCIDFKKLAFK